MLSHHPPTPQHKYNNHDDTALQEPLHQPQEQTPTENTSCNSSPTVTHWIWNALVTDEGQGRGEQFGS
eukprot:scaffold65662_cov46-Cyclotella_meneghiniana.AAC.1